MVADKIYDLLPEELPKNVGDLPATKDDAVAIIEYDGAISTEYFGTVRETASVFHPIVKIVARSSSYTQGRDWMELIKQCLHRYHDGYFMSIMLVGNPIYLGRSEEKLHEFQVTFRTQVRE